MDIFADLIPLAKVMLVFLITVVLQQKFIPIGPAFLAGTLVLQLWFPVPWGRFFRSVADSVLSGQTISLSCIIILIVSLSHSLKITGHFDKIVSSLRTFLAGGRKTVFMLPALVGLLPMPGGAIFSAPMVDEVAKETSLSLRRKAASNHWFRHVWEYTWPLYPGVLLTANLADISLLSLITVNAPLTVISIYAGFRFIALRNRFTEDRDTEKTDRISLKELAITLFPITGVVFSFIITRVLLWGCEHIITFSMIPVFSALPGAGFLNIALPSSVENSVLLFSISVGLAWLLFEYRDLTIVSAFRNKRLPSLVIMIVSLLLFQNILKSSGAVGQITESFIRLSLPLFLLSALLPFIVGLVTGITVGFVAGAFPILIPLIVNTDPGHLTAYLVLGYGFGFMGVMLSPMHVCLVLTVKHFTVSMGKTLQVLILPSLTVMAAAAVMAGILLLF